MHIIVKFFLALAKQWLLGEINNLAQPKKLQTLQVGPKQ